MIVNATLDIIVIYHETFFSLYEGKDWSRDRLIQHINEEF